MSPDAITLGPCQCPGKPHAVDSARMKGPEELRYGDVRRIRGAVGMASTDALGLANSMLLSRVVSWWNLTDEDGHPIPITVDAIDEMHPDQALKLMAAIDDDEGYAVALGIQKATVPLPPENGESSPAGPGASPTSETSQPMSRESNRRPHAVSSS